MTCGNARKHTWGITPWDRHLSTLGRMRVEDIRPQDIEAVYQQARDAGLSLQTIHHIHAVLRASLNQAVRWGVVTVSPMARVEPPEVGKVKLKPPTAEVVGLAVEAARDRWGEDAALMVRLAAATGCRRGELAGLQWGDVDLEAGELHVRRSVTKLPEWQGTRAPKTDLSRRTIALDGDTVDALRARWVRACEMAEVAGTVVAEVAYVLSGAVDSSTWWPPDRYTASWGRIRRAAGIPAGVRLHDLRHWHATALLDAGVPIATVSERLGHAKVTTTLDVYASATKGADRAAAVAMGKLLA